MDSFSCCNYIARSSRSIYLSIYVYLSPSLPIGPSFLIVLSSSLSLVIIYRQFRYDLLTCCC